MPNAYTIRRFPSATGYTFFQVMNPFGQRVYESTDLAKAQAEANRRNINLELAVPCQEPERSALVDG